MKKGILLLLGMMTLVTTIKADEIQKSNIKIGVYNFGTNAVTFIERGIKFHVFLNGDFDYNTRYNTATYYDYNGRRARRPRGIRIERDYKGRVRRVENTFINYNYRGNVRRIGSVFIDYRFGQLVRVGNLRITYNRWGNPRFYGSVKHNDYYNDGFNIDIRFGSIWNYDDDYFYRGDFRHNYRKYKEDANYYYYRAKSNAKIGKRGKLLRRRKANSSHRNDDRKKDTKKRKKNRKEYKKRINKSDNNNSQKHRKRRG